MSAESKFIGTDEQFFNALTELSRKNGVAGCLARECLERFSSIRNEALEDAARVCENRAYINHTNGNPDGGMLNDAFAIRSIIKEIDL